MEKRHSRLPMAKMTHAQQGDRIFSDFLLRGPVITLYIVCYALNDLITSCASLCSPTRALCPRVGDVVALWSANFNERGACHSWFLKRIEVAVKPRASCTTLHQSCPCVSAMTSHDAMRAPLLDRLTIKVAEDIRSTSLANATKLAGLITKKIQYEHLRN
jgi:hypothetical protein